MFIYGKVFVVSFSTLNSRRCEVVTGRWPEHGYLSLIFPKYHHIANAQWLIFVDDINREPVEQKVAPSRWSYLTRCIFKCEIVFIVHNKMNKNLVPTYGSRLSRETMAIVLVLLMSYLTRFQDIINRLAGRGNCVRVTNSLLSDCRSI